MSSHSLSSRWLTALIPGAVGIWRPRDAAAGTNLVEPEMPASELFLLASGEVRCYQPCDDEDRLVEVLGRGDLLNVAVLAGSAQGGIRAVAVTAVTFHSITAGQLHDWLRENPAAAVEIIRHVAARLQTAQEESAALAYDTCQGRLLRVLRRYSDSPAATRTDNRIVLRFTHQQLAQAVGSSRETVSLCLSKLRRRDLLRTERKQLSFDLRALEQFERHWRNKIKSPAEKA